MRLKKLFNLKKLFRLPIKVMIKLIMLEGQFLQKKLLLTPVVYGAEDRLFVENGVNLQNVILNTNSGRIYIGENSFFGHNCMVLTGTHDETMRGKERINQHPVEGNDITIGRGVWISSGSTILGGVTIVDNVVIAAGALVVRSCLEEGVYAGVPAKKIRELKK